MKDHNNNFLKEFNENLYIEEQPFLLFLNKNPNDFDYSTYTSKDDFQYNNYKYFEEECIDFISEKKEDHNIEIYYDIEYSDIAIINTFLDKKEKNKDNFHVIFGNNQELIYNSQYSEQEDKNEIIELIENSHNLIIKNLDSNIKIEDDFEFLNKISKTNKVKSYFKCYKPNFTKSFEDFLSQYELLDKRNFNVENYYYSPYLKFQKFCSYYHEYGDALVKDKFSQYPSKINIAVCGRAGAGKSTLLNVILGEKRCLEGQGQSISTFITSYSHPKYPINFIDFPGFGDKNNAENLIEHIKEKNSQLEKVNEKIHVAIYCIKFGERTFLDKEEIVIYELIKLNVKIIFVFTKGDNENSPQFKRFKNTFLKDLANILEKKNLKINIKEDIKIVSVYSMKEERNGYLIEAFGIDKLFKNIYDYLKTKIIDEDLLEKLKLEGDEEKIDELIKNTELIKINKSRKELIEIIRNKVSVKISLFLGKFILSFPKYYIKNIDEIILSVISDITNLIVELSCIYCKTLDKNESIKLLNKIIKSIKQGFEEGFKITEDKEIKKAKFPWYLRVLGIVLSPLAIILGGTAATVFSLKLKQIICEEFEKEGQINLNLYLYQYAKGLNEGIDGIGKISKDFQKSYQK